MSTTQPVLRKENTTPQSFKGNPVVAPAVDVFESRDEYLLRADLPGVTPDHLNIRLEQGELMVEGTWDVAGPGTLVACEYRPVDFRRVFLVPDAIKVDDVSATLVDGVLEVRIPKSEAVKPKQIRIKVT
jgi:HSP20 family molecular chaperone IbpA